MSFLTERLYVFGQKNTLKNYKSSLKLLFNRIFCLYKLQM